jgi:hypothetical protein
MMAFASSKSFWFRSIARRRHALIWSAEWFDMTVLPSNHPCHFPDRPNPEMGVGSVLYNSDRTIGR